MANDIFTEKVSVNINTSTLSNIDILVDNGYYSNRSDFINHALRESLQNHQNTLDRIIERNSHTQEGEDNHWFVGVYAIKNSDIKRAYEKQQKITISGYGVLLIDDSIEEDMFTSTVEKIKVRGKVIGHKNLKEFYGLK